ncbi:DUF2461 domain-containing protein [Nocardioides sp. CFH 31398]|uniref:DUF2461 domain-containing protein n=1 Tax=Nocardioides sp. CFH 31398 TaxID=2919579 RepID=UPI001F065529|nr:DUF2461 domain-containing protein [Nocardioides sp. CFH 31398]MCH1864962.1 DUF2461 domain-containing protein [Nocardioides sp. CFH 31398]
MTFSGFPVAALDFYDDLEVENTRAFWEQHRATYDESVRAPMLALCASLEAEFGKAKVFRPYRDVRFAKDKTPYKTHQGAFVAAGPSCGWYVQVGAPGVRVGGGFYRAEAPDLARIRDAIDAEHSGRELERLLASLEAEGFERSGEQLKTTPRGWSSDHPRIDLLRHKSLAMGRSYGFEPVIHTPDLADRVREDWLRLRPLVEWVAARLEDLG